MRDYHGPSAEAGLTAQEYRETMEEYRSERYDLADYPTREVPMYKEYNIWDENLDLDEWVPDATTAALVYRIAAATGRRDINITGYMDTEGEEFDRLSVDELNDLAIAEQTRR